jgi:hypothetical protein
MSEHEKDFVAEEVCIERQRNATERFARDKKRLDDLEANAKEQDERTRKIESLNIQMGEILKNHESKLQNHEERISAVEQRPMKFWDKLQWLIIGALVTGIISLLLGTIH